MFAFVFCKHTKFWETLGTILMKKLLISCTKRLMS